MVSEPKPANNSVPWSVLRRSDQIVVATTCAIALVAMVSYGYLHGGHQGERIEIDRVESRKPLFRIDINQADWPELAQLPKIGEVLAKRIVASRRMLGPFRNQADLLRVDGIGPRTVELIGPYLIDLPE